MPRASWTQALAEWIGAPTRAFAAICGALKLLVPDNTRARPRENGSRCHQSLPLRAADQSDLRRDGGPLRYRDPAGSAAPTAGRGEEPALAKVGIEVAVLIIERWLLGGLRRRRFYNLAQLNTAIGEFLRQLKDERPIRRLGVTRRLFEELDRPNLKSLPAQSFAEWRVPHGSSPCAEGPRDENPTLAFLGLSPPRGG
jgi:hypothetical protein